LNTQDFTSVKCYALFSGNLDSPRSLIGHIGMLLWNQITCELHINTYAMLKTASVGLCLFIVPRSQDY